MSDSKVERDERFSWGKGEFEVKQNKSGKVLYTFPKDDDLKEKSEEKKDE